MKVELGAFARIFPRPTAADVASAVAGAGFTVTQLNLSSMGLPTVPPRDADIDLGAIGQAFKALSVRVWGASATYNMAGPDKSLRAAKTADAERYIGQARQLGADFVTLCTGSRDAADMWRYHPDNQSTQAWGDFRRSLEPLLAAAEAAGVRLGVEPEPGNVVSDAVRARKLLDELGNDSHLVGIVMDPANLLSPATIVDQAQVLKEAFDLLGPQVVCLHAKDVVPKGEYSAAGTGQLDYVLVFDLYRQLPAAVPVIIQDASEEDIPRVRSFLLGHAQQS